MSRVGKLPVSVPNNVTVSVEEMWLSVKGPKGALKQAMLPDVTIKMEGESVVVTRNNESKKARSLHGLYRNLVNNMVVGVTQGFSKVLLINGVGYRAELKGSTLILNLGFSNPIDFKIPEGVSVALEGPTKIVVQGIDKALVGQIASEIRSIRPPEPYKGKGVRYENENVRRKVGKSGIK